MTLQKFSGIPRIIHQTWHSSIDTVPKEVGDPYSWKQINPDWDYRFWSDGDLRHFIQTEFPDLLEIYDAYPRAVQRADLARYCLLYYFGGIYSDIDTRCMASLEPFFNDTRVILCEEPPAHFKHAHLRGLPRLFFNGTMASPAQHPFWREVIDLCVRMAPNSHGDVLETTGPLLLSSVVKRWGNKEGLALNSCHLFAPLTVKHEQEDSLVYGPYGNLRISQHYWQGSWFEQAKRPTSWTRKKGRLRRLWHRFNQGEVVEPSQAASMVNQALLMSPLPKNDPVPQVAIFVPVRDGAEFLAQSMALIHALDYPKDKLRIIYGEGNSVDGSAEIIARLCQQYGGVFKEMVQLNIPQGHTISRRARHKAKFQRVRRSAIAQVRNAMLDAALKKEDEWVLWLDVDVCDFSPDVLCRLLEEREKIVVPNCVLDYGGRSFDLNSFVEKGTWLDTWDWPYYYRHTKGGLFQPPHDYWLRSHLHELRYLDRVPLHGVGGSMLLVHANVHRAGIDFPDKPYKDLIETEAFGYWARDMGVTPIALPNLEIRHVKS